MAANDVVRRFRKGAVDIRVYEAEPGAFVAADQSGWTGGVWDTADEALEATKALNNVQGDESVTWSIERVVVGAREALCGAIRGTLAWMLAPVLDIVYPPDSEPEIPMVGCPSRADCREFSCAGYCSEATEE